MCIHHLLIEMSWKSCLLNQSVYLIAVTLLYANKVVVIVNTLSGRKFLIVVSLFKFQHSFLSVLNYFSVEYTGVAR